MLTQGLKVNAVRRMNVQRIGSITMKKVRCNYFKSSPERPIGGKIVSHPPCVESALDRQILLEVINGIHPLGPFFGHERDGWWNGKKQEQADTNLMPAFEPKESTHRCNCY